MSKVLSIRLSDEDSKLIDNYAKFNNISVSEFLRKTAIEKIEDEYDTRLLEAALAENQDDEGISHDEMKKLLGI